MSNSKRLPAALIIEDARAAYLAQYFGIVPDDYKLRVIARMGGACACCGETRADLMTLDHISPLNGRKREKNLWLKLWREATSTDNLRLLCQPCNCAKSDKAECGHRLTARHVLHLMKTETEGEGKHE